MCGGGGGGGGGVSNNRPVSRPPPLSVERPSFSTPESNKPKLDLNSEDTFQGRSVKKAKKPERSIIDRAVDEVKNALPKVGDFIRDTIIGRQPVTEQPPVQSRPNPVVPR